MGVPDGSVLPAGAVDLVEPQPATDVLLIGPKCSLVVRNDLHAVVQYRLLEAAVEIHSPPSMFRAAGQFPASESIDLPLSPYARDFYKTGSPFFLRHLPFWLAVLLDKGILIPPDLWDEEMRILDLRGGTCQELQFPPVPPQVSLIADVSQLQCHGCG